MQGKFSEASNEIISLFSSCFPYFQQEWKQSENFKKEQFSILLRESLSSLFFQLNSLYFQSTENNNLSSATPLNLTSEPILLSKKRKLDELNNVILPNNNNVSPSSSRSSYSLVNILPTPIWKHTLQFLKDETSSLCSIRSSCYYFYEITSSFFELTIPLSQLELYVHKCRELHLIFPSSVKITSKPWFDEGRELKSLPNTVTSVKLIEYDFQSTNIGVYRLNFSHFSFEYLPKNLKELNLTDFKEYITDQWFQYLPPTVEKVILPWIDNGITEKGLENLLHNSPNLEITFSEGRTLFYFASSRGYLRVLNYLITVKNQIHLINYQNGPLGNTPLYVGCETEIPEVVAFLLERGANPSICRIKDCASPLYITCQQGNLQILKLLLSYGANLLHSTDDGTTPLFIACQEGHKEVVQILLEKGAEVNKTMSKGDSPLTIAAFHGHKEIVELLLKFGADVNQKDGDMDTALDNARSKNHTEISSILENYMIQQLNN